jgi:hypothetical protein
MVAELEAHAGRMKERGVTLAVALDRTVFFDSGTGAAIR